jgi:helicase associated protein
VPTVSLLGKWCHAQRGIKATLSPERIARLDALGFPWDAREARWENMFAELVAFKEANGHCDVPAGRPLGVWCGCRASDGIGKSGLRS